MTKTAALLAAAAMILAIFASCAAGSGGETSTEADITYLPDTGRVCVPSESTADAGTEETAVTTDAEITTQKPVETTKPEETTAKPVETTKPEETTAKPVETTKPEETTAKPVETTPEPTSASQGSSGDSPFRLEGDTSGFKYTQERVCSDFGSDVIGSYSAFFSGAADTGITLPALKQNFVPQGIDYWEEADLFLISGYFSPAEASSVILAVERETGKYVGEWALANKNGSAHTAHDGGIAITETDIYLANSSKLFRIPLSQIKTLGNRGTLKIEEEISVPVRASYCNMSGGYLWVGEFSINGNSSYTITGHEFGENYAWTVGYRLGSDDRPEKTPAVVISTPERVQGFCMFDDGRIFMTKSYGRKNDSNFYVSNAPAITGTPDGTVTIGGKTVPIYSSVPGGNYSSVKVIPMAEGCTCIGSTSYVIFESAAYTYREQTPDNVSKNPTDRIWTYSN